MVSNSPRAQALVSAHWLKSHLSAPDVRVLDCTWCLPGSLRTGQQLYEAHHIPGSRFFDIDEISDKDSALPHMLPPPEMFASRVCRLGIGDGHRVICYDQNGFIASARAWWMFRVMGHSDVAVLDGGFDMWKRVGGAVEDLPPTVTTARHFTVRPRHDLVRDAFHVQQAVANRGPQIVDARSAKRFRGEAPEPRPGLRLGHIPGSINIPYTTVVAADGLMKSASDLATLFTEEGVDLSRPIVNTCGSGVTAAILALAQSVVGLDDAAVYDGSWAEWGADGSRFPLARA
jgi:thiosulfate/3-mercaptopyruvate sulfurtransferase